MHLRFILGGDERDEIMRAVFAIQRQLKDVTGKPGVQTQSVIWTNLNVIHDTLTNLPQASN